MQKKVGILAKDKFQGKFMAEWEECHKVVKGNFEELDVSSGIAMAMSVKDEEEQVCFSTTKTNVEIDSIGLQDKPCFAHQVF